MFDLMILAPIGAVAALAYAFILSRRVILTVLITATIV